MSKTTKKKTKKKVKPETKIINMSGNGLRAKCLAATAKVREEFPDKNKKSKFSKKAVALCDMIQGADFGCQSSSVRKLMEIATGEKLPMLKDGDAASFTFVFHALVVALKDDNRKNAFEEGDPILLTARDSNTCCYLSGIDNDGDSYITGYSLRRDLFRPATDKEIKAYFV